MTTDRVIGSRPFTDGAERTVYEDAQGRQYVLGQVVALCAVAVQVVIGGFDGFIVTPLIQQRTVSLPAGLILGSQVLVGILLGGLGVVLATPLVAVAYVLIRKLYVHDLLGDEAVD